MTSQVPDPLDQLTIDDVRAAQARIEGAVVRTPMLKSQTLSDIAGAEIWMDDVSGDGLGDLLIGRQNYMPATGREGAGALTIIFGSDLLRSNAARLAYFDLRSPPPAQCPGGHRGRQRWHLGWNAAHRLG